MGAISIPVFWLGIVFILLFAVRWGILPAGGVETVGGDGSLVDRLRHLPLARDIVIHARQDLVRRLDDYEFSHPELLARVVDFINVKVMPIILRHAISGVATVNSEDPLLNDPQALAMLIDVFSERGYHALIDLHRIEIPVRVDLQTGAISCREKKVFRITIRFRGSEIRRG